MSAIVTRASLRQDELKKSSEDVDMGDVFFVT